MCPPPRVHPGSDPAPSSPGGSCAPGLRDLHTSLWSHSDNYLLLSAPTRAGLPVRTGKDRNWTHEKCSHERTFGDSSQVAYCFLFSFCQKAILFATTVVLCNRILFPVGLDTSGGKALHSPPGPGSRRRPRAGKSPQRALRAGRPRPWGSLHFLLQGQLSTSRPEHLHLQASPSPRHTFLRQKCPVHPLVCVLAA